MYLSEFTSASGGSPAPAIPSLTHGSVVTVKGAVDRMLSGWGAVSWTTQDIELLRRYGEIIDAYCRLLGPEVYTVVADREKFVHVHRGEQSIDLMIAPWDAAVEGSVTRLAFQSGDAAHAYKSLAESKYPYPYVGNSVVVWGQWSRWPEMIGAVTTVLDTGFEEEVMRECDTMLSYIAIMDAVIGRLSSASSELEISTTQVRSIGSEVRQEVVPQILMSVSRLRDTARECKKLSINAQITAQQSQSHTFKVIAQQIRGYVDQIEALLQRIDSVGKKIHFVVDTIEKLMVRIQTFARSSVDEGQMVLATTNDLMQSLQSFRHDLESHAFTSTVSKRPVSEILAEQTRCTRCPSARHTHLHPTIRQAVELAPVFARLMGGHILIGIPTGHGQNRTGMYIAGAHSGQLIPWFEVSLDEPVAPSTLLHMAITEKKDIHSFVSCTESAFGTAYTGHAVRVLDTHGELICVISLVQPWERIEWVRDAISTAEGQIDSMYTIIEESSRKGVDMTHIVNELKVLIEYLGIFSNKSMSLWRDILKNEPWLKQLQLQCTIEGARGDNKQFDMIGGDLHSILSTFRADADCAVHAMGLLSRLVTEMGPIIQGVSVSQGSVASGLDEMNGMVLVLRQTIEGTLALINGHIQKYNTDNGD